MTVRETGALEEGPHRFQWMPVESIDSKELFKEFKEIQEAAGGRLADDDCWSVKGAWATEAKPQTWGHTFTFLYYDGRKEIERLADPAWEQSRIDPGRPNHLFTQREVLLRMKVWRSASRENGKQGDEIAEKTRDG